MPSVTPGVVAFAIDDEHIRLAIKGLRERADRYDADGYHAYARVLMDLASRIEKVQHQAIDDLDKIGGA